MNTKDIEEIVEEFDRNCFNDDGWNMRMYSETKGWLVKTLTTLTQHHEAEVEKAVKAERERIRQWAIEQRDDIIHQITKHGEVDPQRTSYAQIGRKTVLNDLLDEALTPTKTDKQTEDITSDK